MLCKSTFVLLFCLLQFAFKAANSTISPDLIKDSEFTDQQKAIIQNAKTKFNEELNRQIQVVMNSLDFKALSEEIERLELEEIQAKTDLMKCKASMKSANILQFFGIGKASDEKKLEGELEERRESLLKNIKQKLHTRNLFLKSKCDEVMDAFSIDWKSKLDEELANLKAESPVKDKSLGTVSVTPNTIKIPIEKSEQESKKKEKIKKEESERKEKEAANKTLKIFTKSTEIDPAISVSVLPSDGKANDDPNTASMHKPGLGGEKKIESEVHEETKKLAALEEQKSKEVEDVENAQKNVFPLEVKKEQESKLDIKPPVKGTKPFTGNSLKPKSDSSPQSSADSSSSASSVPIDNPISAPEKPAVNKDKSELSDEPNSLGNEKENPSLEQPQEFELDPKIESNDREKEKNPKAKYIAKGKKVQEKNVPTLNNGKTESGSDTNRKALWVLAFAGIISVAGIASWVVYRKFFYDENDSDDEEGQDFDDSDSEDDLEKQGKKKAATVLPQTASLYEEENTEDNESDEESEG